jgi:hypothetical protein
MAVRLVELERMYGLAGAREKFDQLCGQLIRSEFPEARGIRVHRGDGGVDVYDGKFTDAAGIHVFQAKFFLAGLKEAQKQEIRESFKRCITNPDFVTNHWTLCLPINLSIEETKWFEQWAASVSSETLTVDWWGATRLEAILYKPANQGLREAFFKEESLTQIREIHTRIMAGEQQLNEKSKRQEFHRQRLALCQGNAPILPLPPKSPKIILHVIPAASFTNPDNAYNVALLLDGKNALLTKPLRLSSGGISPPHANFEGIVNQEPNETYVQFFRNGIIEAVDTTILGASRDHRVTSFSVYERRVLRTLRRYLHALALLGIEPPVYLLLSLMGVKGFRLRFDYMDLVTHAFDRDVLTFPEIVIDDYNCDLAEVTKPLFDTIANAAKWARSQSYDAEGEPLLHWEE